MRIGMLTPTVSSRGAGVATVVKDLSKCLANSGNEVTILTSDDAYPIPDLTPVEVRRFATIGPSSFALQPSLLSGLRSVNPEVVHLHGMWSFSSVAAWVSRQRGTPAVISPHGMFDRWALKQSSLRKSMFLRLIETAALSSTTTFHALCENELQNIRDLGITAPVAVIPNGVEFSKLPRKAESGTNKHKPSEHRYLLYLGRIHPKKGLVNAIHAFSEAKKDTPSSEVWHLRIAGWGEEEHISEITNAIAECSSDRDIRFVGPVFGSDKEELLRASDALVLPSVSEGLPMAVLEGWSHYLPALITEQCNLSEGYDAGAALRISASREGIKRGMRRLFEMDETQRLRMGTKARRLVEDRFSWRMVSNKMSLLYEWTTCGGPPPDFISLPPKNHSKR